jgi:hypothetical protein
MIGPLSYIGGKRSLAKRIIAIFPEHTTYVEAFAGGAQVFFHKEPSKVEVLSDLDGEIVNFFRVCQLHYEELLRYFRFILVSRKWFDLLKATDPAMLTDVQRAARYLYLLKGSFASLVRHPVYHDCRDSSRRDDWRNRARRGVPSSWNGAASITCCPRNISVFDPSHPRALACRRCYVCRYRSGHTCCCRGCCPDWLVCTEAHSGVFREKR